MNGLSRAAFPAALVLLLLGAAFGHAANPAIEKVLSELQRVEAEREAAIRDMMYTAETTVLEWEDPSRSAVKSETLSLRRVYVRQPDQIHNEFLSMNIDGRRLGEKEMARELAKQRRGGRREGGEEFQSPFSAEAAPQYDFQVTGADQFEGHPVWSVVFSPKQPGEKLFAGTALVSQTDFQPLYVQITPSKLPSVLKELAMSIRFAPVDGYWLPSEFAMDMRVHVRFLVTLTDRTLSILDRYSEYRLNTGLDDEIFAGE